MRIPGRTPSIIAINGKLACSSLNPKSLYTVGSVSANKYRSAEAILDVMAKVKARGSMKRILAGRSTENRMKFDKFGI